MNLVFKNFSEWYENLGSELQDDFTNDLNYLTQVAKDWTDGINDICKNHEIEEIKININLYEMRQALIDAFDDLKRLKEFHSTKNPNPIKIMAYYVFWIIKRKPISMLNEGILEESKLSDTKKLKLLFCNEHYCVQLLIDAIFPDLKEDCGNEKIYTHATLQLKKFKRYMLYYLTYRLDSPKSLEAILLSATMHPIWHIEEVIWENPGDIFGEDL